VVTINEEDISQLPQMKQVNQNHYVKNIGKVGEEVRLLLDCERLLLDEDLD